MHWFPHFYAGLKVLVPNLEEIITSLEIHFETQKSHEVTCRNRWRSFTLFALLLGS